jgi:predicted nuclease of predicted toxin-antitoxin system
VKFFLDHDVPAEVGRVLRQEGHEVIELRQVLPVQTNDAEAFGYAREHDLLLITCNRDDFLALAAHHFNPGMIILVRRRSRHAECGHLLALLSRAGESGLHRKLTLRKRVRYFEPRRTGQPKAMRRRLAFTLRYSSRLQRF